MDEETFSSGQNWVNDKREYYFWEALREVHASINTD